MSSENQNGAWFWNTNAACIPRAEAQTYFEVSLFTKPRNQISSTSARAQHIFRCQRKVFANRSGDSFDAYGHDRTSERPVREGARGAFLRGRFQGGAFYDAVAPTAAGECDNEDLSFVSNVSPANLVFWRQQKLYTVRHLGGNKACLQVSNGFSPRGHWQFTAPR